LKTPEEKANEILNFFDPKFYKKDPVTREKIPEPRMKSSWGTKTRKGAILSVIRIMDDSQGPDSPNKDV